MEENRRNVGGLIIATLTLAVVLGPFVLYIGGYFGMSLAQWTEPDLFTQEPCIRVRVYKTDRLASLFHPAARVEGFLTGLEVQVSALSAP